MDTSPRESATEERIDHLATGKNKMVRVSCVVISPRSKRGEPSYCSLPSRQTKSVLELVLGASYCDGRRSARPRGAVDLRRVRHVAEA